MLRQTPENAAFDVLHNQLDFPIANNPFYHIDDENLTTPARDNFSGVDGKLDSDAELIKIGVGLWSMIDGRGDIREQTAAELHRWARFLEDKAAQIEA